MSGSGNGAPVPYRVSASAHVRQRIRDLAGEAAALGVASEYIGALRQLYQRLRREPLSVGEMTRVYTSLNLVVHVGSSPPVTVRFAVHEEKRLVFLLDIFLRPASL